MKEPPVPGQPVRTFPGWRISQPHRRVPQDGSHALLEHAPRDRQRAGAERRIPEEVTGTRLPCPSASAVARISWAWSRSRPMPPPSAPSPRVVPGGRISTCPPRLETPAGAGYSGTSGSESGVQIVTQLTTPGRALSAMREGTTSETPKDVPSAVWGGAPPLNPCGNTRPAKDLGVRCRHVLRGRRCQQAQQGTIIYTHRVGVLGDESVDRCRQRNSACLVPELVKSKLWIRGPYGARLASEKHDGTG